MPQISNMKKFILCLNVLAFSLQGFAQVDKTLDIEKDIKKRKTDTTKVGWNRGGLINIGFTQGLLENWAAGGERRSLAVNGQINAFATYVEKHSLFENTLDMYYGLNYVESNDFIPRKIDDRIDLSSRYGLQPKAWANSKHSIKKHTYFSGLFRFQSQFSAGYNYEKANWRNNPISEFLAPGFFTLALGADYRPNNNFTVFFSPLAAKFTTVKSSYTTFGPAFGVEQGKTFRAELGAYLSARYKASLNKNVNYMTRLDLYTNYLAKDVKDETGFVIKKDNPGNVDILWDNFFAIKISKVIGAGFGFTMIYDNDQPGKYTRSSGAKDNNGNLILDRYGRLGWIQLKQVFNVGFSYKINGKK